MHYVLDDNILELKTDPNIDRILVTVNKEIKNNKLSPLDKVSLNILYPPSTQNSHPKISFKTHLYYCKRSMDGHNYPAENMACI